MLNINIPTILPDELGIAYLAHVATGNALIHNELLLRVRDTRIRSKHPTKAELVAELAGLTSHVFFCSHTCKPLYGAFESNMRWCFPHGTNERRCHRHSSMKHRRPGYYLCPQCSSEDVNSWGRSYWRRSHQIAGVCWCSKHEIPLNVARGDVLSIQPHELIEASQQCSTSSFPTENTISGRYQTLVASILEFKSPVYLPQIVSKMMRIMRRENYDCWTIAHGQRLVSDTVLMTCSHHWCHDLFPNFHEKRIGEYFRDIDAIELSWDNSAVTYVLALAILYEDPDVAMSLMSNLVGAGTQDSCLPTTNLTSHL